ncbi:MAG: leucine-rich repeat protein [Oscillospiraceae bacterium]|nr:leucine-rich repeat protein [Oscillospiraceae bacterium]
MKHTRKRILSILAAIALSFCSLPQNMPLNPLRHAITASAAETSGTCGENLTWAYNKSTKTLTISGTGNMDDYDACLSLEPAGFYNPNKHRPSYYADGDITKVVIEDGVNGIGAYAFYFQSVTEISIPDSVTTLSKSAFCGCDELTEITLPDSISEISDYAFEDCKILNKVTIKEGTAAIGDYAFCNCEKLTEISLPDSLQSIGDNAFSGCKSLSEINIPKNVQHIGSSAFYNTAWLANFPADEPLVIINGIQYADFTLSDAVQDTVSEFGELAAMCGKELTADIVPGLQCCGNEAELRQLTAILLANAVKYCDAGGSIHAALSRKKHLTLTVTNSCRNVDSIRLDRLFDRFYREDIARTAGSGFGIGLSIAQSIAERHRGSIKAYKADDGMIGFAVKLPIT